MLNSSSNIVLSSLIKQKPIYTLVILSLNLLSTACNILGTVLLIPIFYVLTDSAKLLSTHEHLQLINSLFANLNSEAKPIVMIISLLAIILLKNIASYITIIVGFRYTKEMMYEMKLQGIRLLCEVDFNYYQRNKYKDILVTLNREIEKSAIAIKSAQKLLIVSITIAILTIILITISWQLTLVSLIALGSIISINNWLISQARKVRNASVEANRSSNRRIIEFLAGIRLVKTVANEAAEYQAIAKSMAEKNKSQFQTQLVSATIEPITEVGGTIVILLLIVASYYIYDRAISTTATVLLIYLAVLLRLLPFLSQFDRARLQYINTRSSLEVVANFLDLVNKPISNSGNLNLVGLKTGVEFKAVTFAYPNREQIILDKVDLSIPQGKTIALVGFPSLGNSIISDLLIRFYDPIEGKILLDGKELKEYEPRSLRKAIAVVNRDPFLFNNSLAYNIAYGIDNVTERDIIAAAKKAQIYQFIEQLPAGLATRVGERGMTLSEAQRQKISLARAFLRNPKIVILDEPFDLLDRNFIDFESTQEIIRSLTNQRTALIITKQLDLAKTADRIILFSQGKIIETGTHQQLLQQGNTYQRLYSIQFKTNQQSRQLKLAQKIARKLAQQNRDRLSAEISLNLNTLLNYLESLSQELLPDEEQDTILNESFQSAKDMLATLKAYERKISQGKID